MVEPFQYGLGGLAGVLVGLALGLVGGGGSLLAVPLMVYLVGVPSPHVAIGTSALAVAANALASLLAHARQGHVKWRCATVFAAAGVVGAAAGSTLGKSVPGERLLALFALLMLAVGVATLRRRGAEGDPATRLSRENAPRLVAYGLGAGALSGFFGIGGGFLVVPALVASTGMPILYAIGSSLVAVSAFGVTTAANYALSGWVDPWLAAAFVAGGTLGGWAGSRLATLLAARRGVLTAVLGWLIVAVAAYVLARSAGWGSPAP